MKPVDTTLRSQTESLSFEFDLPHPPEKVWRALTDPILLTEWLLPVVDFPMVAGAAFRFQAPPQREWDGVVTCRLLEIEPPRKVSYTWMVGDMDTVVTFTLTPTTSGTCLSLMHAGFKPDQTQNFAGARYGWKLMGAKLITVLEGVS